MRAMFGLVSILVVVAIIVWLASSQMSGISGPSKQARETASQVAGRDADTGEPVSASATVDLVSMGGKPDSVLVTSLKTGGAYETFWNLKRDDAIVQIGPLAVKDHPMISTTDDASAVLMDAYQKRQDLIVVRDGERTTLSPSAKPTQPGPSPSGQTDPLQQQIDSIQNRRGL